VEYKNWADEIYIEYCKELSDNDFEFEIEGYQNSAKKILGHLLEVSWFWLKFITDQNYSDEPDIERMKRSEIITGLLKYNQMIVEYVQNDDLSKQFEIQWDENDKVVVTTAENVIFNFISHSAYHRGQLAIYLRLLGIETIKETDFNPYIYIQGQNS
jgi:uncharacterized damage-inducible protein DinB